MMISHTGQSSINLVRKYLKWVVKYYPNADERFISELLRYSLCELLRLESQSANRVVKEVSVSCIGYLRRDIQKAGIVNKPLDMRQAYLESCVHCIEFTRKRCIN